MSVTTKKKKTESAKPSSKGISNIPLYTNAHAHLLDELRWLNCVIAAQVLRLRRVNFYDGLKDFRGFFIDDDEIDALLAAGIFEENGQSDDKEHAKQIIRLLSLAQSIRLEINQRVDKTFAQNISLPLVQLGQCFSLSNFELQALIICMAPQIDARYEKLYAYLQNDITKKCPTVELVLSLLCQKTEERLQLLSYFNASAPLRSYRLLEGIENGSGATATHHLLRVDQRIVQYVLGNQAMDERLLSHLRFLPPIDWQAVVLPEALQNRLQKLMQTILLHEHPDPRPALYLHGRPGVGKKTIARALCSDIGVAFAVVDAGSLMSTPETFRRHVRLILREGLLQPCAVYFDHLEKLQSMEKENAVFFATLAQELSELGWLTFFGSEHSLPEGLLDTQPVFALQIPAPDYAAQNRLWEMHLNGSVMEKGAINFDELTSHFDLTGAQIGRAVQFAEQNVFIRDSEQGHVRLADLMETSRMQSQPALGKLALKIEPLYTWEDIVLPDDTVIQLQEICQRVRHRHRVLDEWGFAQKLTLGKGVNALFAGPTGTGKTMAVEVVANELQLDLYKIDLSGVVSKYIGETEKNLDRIFTTAEHANAILFFDEADALFGKRSEVRDSHDRYANIEISYLLQKMEQYEGIAILATNLRQNLDEAFVRRLAFTVHFPFPDESIRLQIWQGIWPAETPLSEEVDPEFLASQFKLSGGNIKNVALAAAFLAAENGSEVRMAQLTHGIRREYQKMGKPLSEAELGRYAEETNA